MTQRLPHRSRHLVEGGLAAASEGQQGAVDAPDRAEQADERRGAADRSQHGQAVFQRGAFRIERLPQGAGHEAVQIAGAGRPGTVAGDPKPGVRQASQRMIGVRVEGFGLFGMLPEPFQKAPFGVPLPALVSPFQHDHRPGHDRHDQQDGGGRQTDGVRLIEIKGYSFHSNPATA
jgi:hypothetical protein